MKCFGCNGKIRKNIRYKNCSQCEDTFHIKCSTKKTSIWNCSKCLFSQLPFHSSTNEDLYAFLSGLNSTSSDFLKNIPSFNLKTLLDSLPGENFSKDDFISNTITSKYYSPIEFKQEKFRKRQLSMAHLNIASLQLHIEELRHLLLILDHPFDIIAITETRLQQQDSLIDISISGYDFLHTETHTTKGGAGIYIKDTIDYNILTNLNASLDNVCESMFIEIKNKNKKNLIVGSIYRHHTTIEKFRSDYMDETMKKILKTKKVAALLGDFNVNLLDYSKHTSTSEYYDNISSSGFRPLILQPTRVTSRSSTLIDNIFINDLTCFSNGGNIVTSISDHYMQFSILDIFDVHHEKFKDRKSVRNWRIFNKREFKDELSRINWNEIITPQMSTNESCSKFYNTITKLLDEMAPFKKLTKKELKLKQNPWITPGILASMRTRDQLHKNFLKENILDKKEDLFNQYKKYRNMIISLIRKSKRKYYFDFFNKHNTNIKKTWEGIRQLVNINKNKSVSIKLLKNENNSDITDNKEMANSFNNFFSNIGNSVEKKIPRSQKCFSSYLTTPINSTFNITLCNEIEIKNIISNLGVNKASGPNSIPTSLLKEFSSLLIEPITNLINKSLTEGTFPSLFKMAQICPIYKKSDKTKCANYRPISLLSNLSKIFERIMYNRLEKYLEKHSLLYDHQFGFRKSFSTEHALMSITEQIRSNFRKKSYSCGVFVDLEKAFDTVNHSILISKLRYYGLKEPSLSWLSSYLSNRLQQVSLNGQLSTPKQVTCGVPQGSILGPLLFLIYINDMNKAINNSTVYHFADDTNLLYSHKNPKTLKKVMNIDLKSLYEWLCANRLSLNVSKTEFMIFRPPKKTLSNRIVLTLNRTKIYESTKIKYLGLLLDSRLSWKEHINELTKKLGRSVGMLYKAREYCPTSVLKSLYYSIFHSHVSYGIPVWGYANDDYIKKISKMQKKAIRAITFSKFKEKSAPLFKKLQILKITDLVYQRTAALLWDLNKEILPPTLSAYFTKACSVHDKNTRFAISGSLKVVTKTNSFQSIGTHIFNDLNNKQLFSVNSKNSFLDKIKFNFISKY